VGATMTSILGPPGQTADRGRSVLEEATIVPSAGSASRPEPLPSLGASFGAPIGGSGGSLTHPAAELVPGPSPFPRTIGKPPGGSVSVGVDESTALVEKSAAAATSPLARLKERLDSRVVAAALLSLCFCILGLWLVLKPSRPSDNTGGDGTVVGEK